MKGFQETKKSGDNIEKSQAEGNKKDKRMPIWGLVITDILLTGVCLCIFALYHHVLPRNIQSKALVVATATEDNSHFTIPERKGEATSNSNQDSDTWGNNGNSSEAITSDNEVNSEGKAVSSDNKPKADNKNSKHNSDNSSWNGYTRNYGNTNTMNIASDRSVGDSISSLNKSYTEAYRYHSDKIDITSNMVEIGDGSEKITYYISDIYVSDIKYLKSAFAEGKYGKNLRDTTLSMAKKNNALLAISGDFYGNGETGLVIRNGVLYRDVMNDADVCVLFTDGSMKTYSPEEFNLEDVIAKGAWQAWTFGPGLLDGNGAILSSFNTTTYLNSTNPRCAIGYVEPGHYVFMVVDGRDPGYSKGVTLSELASLMVDAGCKVAYNLDGGKSAAMVYKDDYVNIPCEGGRSISDIVYLGE